jgi:hypothetical protein
VALWLEEFVFAEPLWDLRGDDELDRSQRAAMQEELLRELPVGHELAGRTGQLARCAACDDVVVLRIEMKPRSYI